MNRFHLLLTAVAVTAVLCFSENSAQAQIVPSYSPGFVGSPVYSPPPCSSCMGSSYMAPSYLRSPRMRRMRRHRSNCRGYTQQIRQLRIARRHCRRQRLRRFFSRLNPLNYGGGYGSCGCNNYCFQPVQQAPCCSCGVSPMMPAPSYTPTYTPMNLPPAPLVPQTSMAPQPVTTYQDVTRTMVRREAYREVVPVTTYQTRIRYRDVPYQVTNRVARTHMQYMPPVASRVSSGCNTCQQSSGMQPQWMMPSANGLTVQPSTVGLPSINGTPMNGMAPIDNGMNYGLPKLSTPVPVSAYQPMPTQPMGARNMVDSNTANDGYNEMMPKELMRQMPKMASKAGKKFTAAPSAARVMRTRLR